jgi:hypothetical protein
MYMLWYFWYRNLTERKDPHHQVRCLLLFACLFLEPCLFVAFGGCLGHETANRLTAAKH